MTFRDELLLYIVECDRTAANLHWIESYKNDTLLNQFQQIEIYLAVTEILWLEKPAAATPRPRAR